ncbi:MAG: ComF family protein [Erysipelotrichaceae bacterium]
MRCLYCDREIINESFYSLFFERDMLCPDCRKGLGYKHRKFLIDGIKCESFYSYNTLFKQLLLQYKECYDEALKDVFLYRIKENLMIKYHGYKIMYVPSSKEKLSQRGFNHLEEIFSVLNLEEIKGLRMKEELCQQNKDLKSRSLMIDNYIYEGNRADKLLIVDDVCTSGSSLKGVFKAVKPYAREIRALVLARVD